MHTALPSLSPGKKNTALNFYKKLLSWNLTPHIEWERRKLTSRSANVDILLWNPAIWQSRNIPIGKTIRSCGTCGLCANLHFERKAHFVLSLVCESHKELCGYRPATSRDVGQPYNQPGIYRFFTCLFWHMWLTKKVSVAAKNNQNPGPVLKVKCF